MIQVDLELRLLDDWQSKEEVKTALEAWLLHKEEREVKEEVEQRLDIELMEVLELERREEERHIAVGEEIVKQDEAYLDLLVESKAGEQLEEEEHVLLEFLEEEQRAREEIEGELNEESDFLLFFCVDNVGPAKDSSYKEFEEMLADLEEEQDKYEAIVREQEIVEERKENLVEYLATLREEEEKVLEVEKGKQVYTVSVPLSEAKEVVNDLAKSKEDNYVFIGDEKYLYTGDDEIPWAASDDVKYTAPSTKAKQCATVREDKTNIIGEEKTETKNNIIRVREVAEITIEEMRKKIAEEEKEEEEGIEIVTTVSRGVRSAETRDFRKNKMLQKRQKLSFLGQNLTTNKTSFTRGSRPPPNKADKSKVEAKRERSESPEIEVLDQLTSKEKRNHFPIAKKPRR